MLAVLINKSIYKFFKKKSQVVSSQNVTGQSHFTFLNHKNNTVVILWIIGLDRLFLNYSAIVFPTLEKNSLKQFLVED